VRGFGVRFAIAKDGNHKSRASKTSSTLSITRYFTFADVDILNILLDLLPFQAENAVYYASLAE
jgi:hypothetical protein